MARRISPITRIILIAMAAGALVYFLTTPLGKNLLERFKRQVTPCASPISYSIGALDTRFGIPKSDLLNAIDEAARIWETPMHRTLFAYTPSSGMRINLVYDYRQEATDRLKRLGIVIDDSKSAYDTLKTRYDALHTQYENAKTAFDAAVNAYETHAKAYDTEVAYWNSRGGAPQDIYDRLTEKRSTLDAESNRVSALQTNLNALVDDVNAAANMLNALAATLNLNVVKYNLIGRETGETFEEGAYKSSAQEQEIDIYQFSSRAKLLKVLAHELGHALGLQHSRNPNDIMYYSNEGSNAAPTTNDIAQLQARCGIR